MRNLFVVGLVWILGTHSAVAQVTISSFTDIDSLIRHKSYLVKNGNLELEKAHKAKLAGLMGIPDPTGSVSLGYTNNTQLPVSVFPAEILGGTPGTYEKVELGTKYTANFNTYVDLKLLNLAGINNFRLSKVNIKLTEVDQSIRLRDLYQNAAKVYFNILTLQSQRKATEQYLGNSDQLVNTVSNKLDNGLASPQELNDARIIKLQQEENLRQIDFQIALQMNNLKSLVDIDDSEHVLVQGKEAITLQEAPAPMDAKMRQQKAELAYAFARTSLAREKSAFLPTVSFVMNYQSQWFDVKPNPFRSSQSWIPSNYLGLRLNMPLPGSIQIGNYFNQKYQTRKMQLDTKLSRIQDELEVSRLATDLRKVKSEHASALDIAGLRKLNYGKNLLNYEAGLVTLEYTINSLNTLVDADYAAIAARHKVSLQEQLIMINNTIK